MSSEKKSSILYKFPTSYFFSYNSKNKNTLALKNNYSHIIIFHSKFKIHLAFLNTTLTLLYAIYRHNANYLDFLCLRSDVISCSTNLLPRLPYKTMTLILIFYSIDDSWKVPDKNIRIYQQSFSRLLKSKSDESDFQSFTKVLFLYHQKLFK